jgi:hypothetical protein
LRFAAGTSGDDQCARQRHRDHARQARPRVDLHPLILARTPTAIGSARHAILVVRGAGGTVRRRQTALLVAFVVGAATVTASCSSGSGKSDPAADRSTWDSAASAQLQNLATRIAKALPQQCSKLVLVDAELEIKGINKLGDTVIPKSMGSCSVLGEDDEFAMFADPGTRDTWVAERSRLLCDKSEKAKVGFPGLHWVVGGNWSAVTDTEGAARLFARRIGGKYKGTPCPGKVLDWNPGAVAQAEAIAVKIDAAGLGCSDFIVDDLEAAQRDQLIIKVGVPATLGHCSAKVAADGSFLIVATRPKSVSLEKFVAAEMGVACPQAPSFAGVVGSDWAVFSTRDVVARRVARVTGGKVRVCAQ